MKEINISQLSNTGAVSSKRKKLDPKIFKYIFPLIIILVFVCYVVNSMMWKSYNEKYYLHFLEKNNIDVSCIDDLSLWGYVPYTYKNTEITLEFHKPSKNKYTFGAGLLSEYRDKMEYWTTPFINYKFTYELDCGIDRFGRKEYTFDAYKYRNDPNNSFGTFGLLIKEDGTFVYSSDGFSELTDEERRIIDYLRDDILELKAEVDSIIS